MLDARGLIILDRAGKRLCAIRHELPLTYSGNLSGFGVRRRKS